MKSSQVLSVFVGAIVIFSVAAMEKITDRTEPPGPVHIAYWEKWTGFELEGMRQVVNDFNRSQNRIVVDLLSTSDVGNKTMFAVSAGAPPDVAGLWGEDVPQYVDDRAIIPLDKFCRESGLSQRYYIPAYWQMMTYKNHVWALPTTPASSALVYNTKVFREMGVDPDKPPRTLEDMLDYAKKLTIEKDGHLTRAGFLPAEPGDWDWGWGYFFGGRLWDGKSKITADSPENEKGYDWVSEFAKLYGPSEAQTFRSGFGNFASPQNSFVEGQVAMELQGVWTHNFVSRYAPDLKIGVAPFPHPAGRPDLAGTSFVGLDIMVIPRGAPHPREAFEFMRFVQRQDEMEKLCMSQQKNSPLTNVSDNFYKNNLNPDTRLWDALARGTNAFPPPRMALWKEYAAEMTNACDEVNLGLIDGRQAMRMVQARMQPKLDEYLSRMDQRDREGL